MCLLSSYYVSVSELHLLEIWWLLTLIGRALLEETLLFQRTNAEDLSVVRDTIMTVRILT